MKWLLIGFTVLLTACGGEQRAEAPASAPAESPTATPLTLTLHGALTVPGHDSVALAIMPSPGHQLDTVTWLFEDDDIEVLAPTSGTIGFDAPAAGTYPFTVTATDTSGNTQTLRRQLTVTAEPAGPVQLRLSHQAVESGRVSLKVTVSNPDTIEQIDWQVINGPTVSFTRAGEPEALADTVYFQAPAVTTDTLIEIEVSVQRSSGEVHKDNAYVMVTDTPAAVQGFFANNDIYPTDLMQAYRDGPYSQALERCVYTSELARSCRFSTLPLIGQLQQDTPDIETILQRTLVSHRWMGVAFEQFLLTSAASADIRRLLRAATAVVIAYDIRPSFYWSATGAIYLDANQLWQTPAQRDTLDRAPDYRTSFGDTLQYRSSWRYVANNELYYPQAGLPETKRLSRTQSQVNAALTWLLFHELAHANDFFPPSSWARLSASDSPLSYANNHAPVSVRFSQDFELASDTLSELAQVSYGGATATTTQQALTVADIAGEFAADSAVSMYSYFTVQEDFATLFERFMMLHRLQVEADIGLFDSDAFADETLTISWAQRNRINASHIQARAGYVVHQLLPELATAEAQNAMPAPQLFSPGTDWFTTFSPGQTTSVSNTPNKPVATKTGKIITHGHFEQRLPLPELH
ncbi:PKD domain-containing protein [Salinimonas marina]|uniref:PKD domain-containing protein n=1 Tax=Salinimonas marina TaxID=2785918 RepID=A0A7S9DZN1_9ALTE|nr:PKD domain-containing protein [Salinimonas marina]QPG06881.1 PKD domain-containing protein [Salinimonas marina]